MVNSELLFTLDVEKTTAFSPFLQWPYLKKKNIFVLDYMIHFYSKLLEAHVLIVNIEKLLENSKLPMF